MWNVGLYYRRNGVQRSGSLAATSQGFGQTVPRILHTPLVSLLREVYGYLGDSEEEVPDVKSFLMRKD